MGEKRLGRLPTLPSSLERGPGEYRLRDGRHPARRPLAGTVRLLFLGPLYRGLHLHEPTRSLPPMVTLRHVELTQPLPRQTP